MGVPRDAESSADGTDADISLVEPTEGEVSVFRSPSLECLLVAGSLIALAMTRPGDAVAVVELVLAAAVLGVALYLRSGAPGGRALGLTVLYLVLAASGLGSLVGVVTGLWKFAVGALVLLALVRLELAGGGCEYEDEEDVHAHTVLPVLASRR